ncbi:MAG TPA: NAD(P)/FAD-dependent oxidoreductase [Nevskiaceae bacterium]|nr:NAD(P)/FAD-dependent oxidoreductase [Nevskiaceae bacterium]
MAETLDVLIIGAGLSGIGAACHLAREFPAKSVAILERRQSVGGTWDLFRYPGIRSDSDMFSFGYDFRPWPGLKVLADGPSIRQYVRETAAEYGVDRKIRFGLKTTEVSWSSAEGLWTVTAVEEASGRSQTLQARYLISCTGYYNYDQGYLPDFPGVKTFKGRCIHPQHWPEDLDYAGKKVVVIGSGATAVTLVPAMADTAAHVTMLQRSPSYIFSVPGYDKISALLRRVLPESVVFKLARARNIALQRMIYKAAKRWPQKTREFLLKGVEKELAGASDMRHFTPRYMPWDERLCAVPDGDLFKAIRAGKASVVTDEIETFTERGIRLKSGQELEADIVITATGLQIQLFGGVQVKVDGQSGHSGQLMTYKGTLLEGVPNLAFIVGYTNAPWTLKADLSSRYFCRLLKYMDEKGHGSFVVRAPEGEKQADESILDSLGSGYIRRARDVLPRQGRQLPWRVLHNYERDKPMLLEQAVDDGVIEFSPPPAQSGGRRKPPSGSARGKSQLAA